MTSRRWRDPRNQRTWEVTVTGVAPSRGARGVSRRRHAVCFDTTGTPRQELLVDCCERAESLFPELQDQDLAFCLDAAREGGLLWVDPRDGELWWIRERGDVVELRSAALTLRVPHRRRKPLKELGDADIVSLLEDAVPASVSAGA